jgi:molybdate transport system substrate-binding protein
VPADYHSAIVQDAVLLRPGERNSAARAYLEFLRTPAAQEVIRSFGYAVPPQRQAP